MQTGMRVLLAVAALALVATPVTVQAASSFTDVDVLNFALNLECLEAEFYSWVAYGKGIASFDGLVGNSSSALKVSSSGGVQRSSSFSTEAIAIATEIAENEIKHVSYLRSALKDAGATAVNCPNVDVSPAAFTAAAKAAAPTLTTSTSAPVFSPYSSDTAFYIGAFIFEDVGVTAYKGAVQVLQSQAYATVAAGIGAVEAGHAAIIRQQLYQRRSAATGLTAGSTAITVQAAVQAIADLRDAAGGTASASVENYLVRTPATFTGVTTSLVGTTGPDLFAANKTTAVAFTRIPRQVLDIVYLGTYATPGGFFPSGISGNTHVVNATGTPTTTACSGAFSMASLSAVVPLVLTGVAVLFGVMW